MTKKLVKISKNAQKNRGGGVKVLCKIYITLCNKEIPIKGNKLYNINKNSKYCIFYLKCDGKGDKIN